MSVSFLKWDSFISGKVSITRDNDKYEVRFSEEKSLQCEHFKDALNVVKNFPTIIYSQLRKEDIHELAEEIILIKEKKEFKFYKNECDEFTALLFIKALEEKSNITVELIDLASQDLKNENSFALWIWARKEQVNAGRVKLETLKPIQIDVVKPAESENGQKKTSENVTGADVPRMSGKDVIISRSLGNKINTKWVGDKEKSKLFGQINPIVVNAHGQKEITISFELAKEIIKVEGDKGSKQDEFDKLTALVISKDPAALTSTRLPDAQASKQTNMVSLSSSSQSFLPGQRVSQGKTTDDDTIFIPLELALNISGRLPENFLSKQGLNFVIGEALADSSKKAEGVFIKRLLAEQLSKYIEGEILIELLSYLNPSANANFRNKVVFISVEMAFAVSEKLNGDSTLNDLSAKLQKSINAFLEGETPQGVGIFKIHVKKCIDEKLVEGEHLEELKKLFTAEELAVKSVSETNRSGFLAPKKLSCDLPRETTSVSIVVAIQLKTKLLRMSLSTSTLSKKFFPITAYRII